MDDYFKYFGKSIPTVVESRQKFSKLLFTLKMINHKSNEYRFKSSSDPKDFFLESKEYISPIEFFVLSATFFNYKSDKS